LRVHEKVKGHEPLAPTWKPTTVPAVTVSALGEVVMLGATLHKGHEADPEAQGGTAPARLAAPPTRGALFAVVVPSPSLKRRFKRRLAGKGGAAMGTEHTGTAARAEMLLADRAVFHTRI
jgi:hypothetical protein